MRLFAHACRETGLTWTRDPITDTRGSPHEFCMAARGADAIVAYRAEALVGAVRRRCASEGSDSSGLDGVPLVDLDGLTLRGPAPRPGLALSASAVADRYLRPPEALGGLSPSPEQWAILRAYECGDNVMIQAVAGAGKTTTLLMCAGRRPGRTLLLTYNKRLQLEVSRRAGAGVEVLTYHAAAGRAYGLTIRNDAAFRACLGAAPENPPRFDRLMLDEAQDMAVEYFVFVRWLLRANPGAQLIVVGDELQAINEYRGARPEFLTEAPALYASLSGRPWRRMRLGTSHRLTPATATFVNTHLYSRNIIAGGNRRDPNRRPIYIAAKGFAGVKKALFDAVGSAVREFGPEGVFVLAASVRGLSTKQSPLAELVRHHLIGIPTYVAGNDDEAVDHSLIRGKLAILSFNAVKGCERPCVVVLGLDEMHFTYYDKAWKTPLALPNVLTVAATRASALLVVVADAKSTLRTVKSDSLRESADVRGTPAPPSAARRAIAKKNQHVSVTALIRHQHPETVRDAMSLVMMGPARAVPTPARDDLPGLPPAGRVARSKIKFGDLVEDLSFVYGTIAPVLAEVAITGQTLFGDGLEAPIIVDSVSSDPFSYEITAEEHAAYPPLFWEQITEAALTGCSDRTPEDWGRLAIARHALWEGRHHIARQVTDYDWLDGPALSDARDTIRHALGGVTGRFEARLPARVMESKEVHGIADFVEDSGVVWEFKLVDEVRGEHVLQLACYLALKGGGEGILLDIRRREARDVYLSPEDSPQLLRCLIEKRRDVVSDVFDLIEQFDQAQLANTLPEIPNTAEEDAGAAPQWDMADVYD